MATTTERVVDLTNVRPPSVANGRTIPAPERRPCGCLVINVAQFGHRPYCEENR